MYFFLKIQIRFYIIQAIRNECFGGSGDRPEAKNVAIVITDGVPYPANRRQPAIDEAEKLRMENSEKPQVLQYFSL